MRMRLTVAALALAAAPAAHAQQPAPAGAAPGACTYDTCALRRESVFFSERLVAGTRGTVAVRPRAFGVLPLDSIVRGVPEAAADARVYRTERVRGGLLSLAGTVLGVVAVVDAYRRSNDGCAVAAGAVVASCGRGWDTQNTALVVGGAGFNLLAAWRLKKADRALNRSLWWYNRSLAR
jgi:hypothetical protein